MADSLREGVYIQMAGPQFESVAELKMLKVMGVDAVGETLYPIPSFKSFVQIS